jgi:transcriptional regulator with XRE-family HTH domain
MEKKYDPLIVKIKKMLEEKRVSQVALATALGVSEERVSKWVSQGTGLPDPYKLKKMSTLFDVPMTWWVDDEVLDPPPPVSNLDSGPAISKEEEHVLYLARTIGIEEATRRMAMVPPKVGYPGPGYQDEKKEPRRSNGTGK